MDGVQSPQGRRKGLLRPVEDRARQGYSFAEPQGARQARQSQLDLIVTEARRQPHAINRSPAFDLEKITDDGSLEWLNAGVSRTGGGEAGGWIGLPQLRMGVVF
jgi:hypothetical protein